MEILLEQNKRYIIGRDEHCDIQLNDRRISRRHLEVYYDSGKWFIKDLTRDNLDNDIREVLNNDNLALPPFQLSLILISEDKSELVKNEISSEDEVKNDSDDSDYFQASESESEETSLDFPSMEEAEQNIEAELEQEHDLGFVDLEESSFSDAGDKTMVSTGFAQYEITMEGKYAPYDRFILNENETFIGRDTARCQIVLLDEEVSGVHAVIRKKGILCYIEDLESSNGTLLNGDRVNKSELSHGDILSIGSTTFTVRVTSDLIQAESGNLLKVQSEVPQTNRQAGDFNTEKQPRKALFSLESLKDPDKRKKILMIVAGLLLAWTFLGDSPEKSEEQNKNQEQKVAKSPSAEKVEAVKETELQKPKKVYTNEEKEFLNSTYLLSKELFSKGDFREAIFELEKIFQLDSNFKLSRQIYERSKEGLARLEQLERERKAKIEEKIRQDKVSQLLEKANSAVKAHQALVAESIFNQIIELDPENLDIAGLRMELEAWQKEQERKALVEAEKEAERKRQLDKMMPGKTYFLKEQWYEATLALEDFLKLKGMDEDLVKEATEMLSESKNKLNGLIAPLLGKARSLYEGQDLKGAHESYKEILVFNPYHEEAVDKTLEIEDTLEKRSRLLFQEALVAESLSFFPLAAEKFREVLQVSPSGSSYSKKANEKLKSYEDKR